MIIKQLKQEEIFIISSIIFYTMLAYPVEMITGHKVVYFFEIIMIIFLAVKNLQQKHSLVAYIILILLGAITFLTLILNPLTTVLSTVRQYRFYLLGYLLYNYFRNINEKKRIINIISYSLILCMLFAAIVLFRQYVLGWTDYEQRWITNELNRDISKIADTRFFSTFPSANNASLFFVTTFLISLWRYEKSLIFKLGLITSLVCTVLTQMKIGYFVIAIIILFYLNSKIIYKLIILVLIGSLVVGIEKIASLLTGEYFAYTTSLFDTFGIKGLFDKAIISRFGQIKMNMDFFTDSFSRILFGAGFVMSNTIVYIDNLFYLLVFQSGIIVPIILTVVFMYVVKNIQVIDTHSDLKFIKMFILVHFIFSLSSNVLNSVITFYIFIMFIGIFNHQKKSNKYMTNSSTTFYKKF